MKSKIYTGQVMHQRLEKAEHRFDYPAYFYAFDLDELEELGKTVFGFGYNRFAPVAIYDRDYLQRGAGTIRQKLDGFLQSHGLKDSIERVTLVTSARFFNHVFNPVSFYYCYSSKDRLTCVVLEVNNTFDERHLYILDQPLADSNPQVFHAKTKKEFHVSPFFDRSGEYDCRFSAVSEEIDIHVNLFREGKPALISRLTGKAKPLTSLDLWKVVFQFPLAVFLTLPRIHWQAAKLYFSKKISHHSKPVPEGSMTIRVAQPNWKQRMARKLVFDVLSKIKKGRLKLVLPDGQAKVWGNLQSSFCAELKVNHDDFFVSILKDAGIGLGESFMSRHWESQDPVGVLNVLIENKEEMKVKDFWLGLINKAKNRFAHQMRKNSIGRSRQNIREHYDLSNDFFKLFLDPTLMYSCAFFSHPTESLETAQRNKIRKIIEKARIGKNDHVLEIGCGWGGFAIEAVKQTGCRVTGITLSEEQLKSARERVWENGLQEKIEFLLCDYRKLEGQFDKIVSIEMLEAVGHEYLGTYFQNCDRLLKPDGLGVFQVITMPDQRYRDYRHGYDFIQKHIFPGGHLPSLTALCESMTESSALMMDHIENIGDHYAETLKLWREQFMRNRGSIEALGFSPAFIRKWEYYFIYCESAYRMRHINNLQFVVTRAGNRTLIKNSSEVYAAV